MIVRAMIASGTNNMKKKVVVYSRRSLLLWTIWIYDDTPTCRKDALKFRFQCLSWSLFHIDTVAIVSAPSASLYTSPPIASSCVRANFIRHTRRFFSDSAGSAPRERAQPTKGKEGKGQKGAQITSAQPCRMLHRPSRAAQRAATPSVRSLSASYYYSTVGHTLAACVFHVPRFAPDEEEAEDEDAGGTRDTPKKRKSGMLTRTGHWRRKKKNRRRGEGKREKLPRMNTRFRTKHSADIRRIFLRDRPYFFLRLKERNREYKGTFQAITLFNLHLIYTSYKILNNLEFILSIILYAITWLNIMEGHMLINRY